MPPGTRRTSLAFCALVALSAVANAQSVAKISITPPRHEWWLVSRFNSALKRSMRPDGPCRTR
jgi:hypothetical protein